MIFVRLFNLFKKKSKITDKDLKWNRMWELWVEGKVVSPYSELMTYQSEINNGGHVQFFDNVARNSDLLNIMTELNGILSSALTDNIEKAYSAYLALEKNEDDEKAQEIIEKCDNVFFENENEINFILDKFSDAIEL